MGWGWGGEKDHRERWEEGGWKRDRQGKNNDSEKVTGHADLSSYLSWRESFLYTHTYAHYTGSMLSK